MLQGSGLELLIFSAIFATTFMAMCTLTLCRKPADIVVTSPALMAIEHSSRLDAQQQQQQQQQVHVLNQQVPQQQVRSKVRVLNLKIFEIEGA